MISGSFAKNDLQFKVSYGSSPPCTQIIFWKVRFIGIYHSEFSSELTLEKALYTQMPYLQLAHENRIVISQSRFGRGLN